MSNTKKTFKRSVAMLLAAVTMLSAQPLAFCAYSASGSAEEASDNESDGLFSFIPRREGDKTVASANTYISNRDAEGEGDGSAAVDTAVLTINYYWKDSGDTMIHEPYIAELPEGSTYLRRHIRMDPEER